MLWSWLCEAVPSLLLPSPAPSDYVAVDENITFSSNDSHYSLTLQIVDNMVVEDTESFEVSLSLPSNQRGVQLGTDASATVTISDDDSECSEG